MADDEEEEFEDAVEKFDKPNQLNKPASIPLPRAAVLHHGAISQGMSLNDNSISSVRRDRLSALRNRMREEFGSRDNGTPSATRDDDSSSIISDATSLHSWHRRVLAGPDTVIVLPTDSVSTYAAPATGNNYPSLWSPVPSEKEAISPSIPESGVFRPPNRPPPPIPLRERGFSSPTDVSVPPPLPPRTPSYRLPDALSSSPHFSDNSAEKVWSPTQSSLQPQAQQVLTNSNESVTSSSDCLKQALHKKGHVKSNSLDRGLTLAKSLKAGPFPPPSNKSNSLTRAEEDGEEKERNTAAEGVIRLITTGLIPEKGFKTEPLDTIPSCSSSISTPSSQMSKKTQDVEDEQCIMHQIIVEESRETNSGENCESLEPARPVSSVFSPHPVIASSVDPITRDVERRMSMKRDGTLPDNLSDDGKSERFSTARNTVDQARNLARSYGTLASGILRGAIQKVKGSSSRASSSKVEEATSESDGEQSESGNVPSGTVTSIVRPRKTKKGPYDFENLTMVQEISNEHTGAVWCIRFSVCGRLIATAGQDAIIRVWAVKSHIKYFQEMRERYQQKTDGSTSDVFESTLNDMESFRPPSSADSQPMDSSFSDDNSEDIISGKPFALFKGHTADILDLSWSKNYFILSSGMDRTVKLWHISRNECLCCFQHVDFVTCVAFLPKDDRYFLSGSLDGKLRLWYIPDKKVAVWNEVQVKFITALTFVKNGKFAVVGTYNGRCYFYTSDQLKYHTVVDVRSSRGKNARGHKITGLAVHGDKLLVTSNDSRIRMYDVRDKALACKFRGAQNEHSQIRAAFSPDGKHIICGSEDKFIYLWRTSDLPSTLSVRKDRNAMWERVRSHAAPVSVAVFASKPQVFFSILDRFARMLSSIFGFRQAISATFRRTLCTAVPSATLDVPEETATPDAEVTNGNRGNANVKQVYSSSVLQKLKLDQYPLYVEREWWKKGKRMTFWATWRQLRDVNRREVLQEHGADRMRWKAIKDNSVLPQAIRDEAAETLFNMPRYSRPRQILNMCQFTGRQRGKIKPYRLNRHLFRMKVVLSLLLLAAVVSGSSVQFSYLPQSLKLSSSVGVKSSDLDQLNANLLGLSTQPVEGVVVSGDIFSRPKALVQIRIDGLDTSVDSITNVDLTLNGFDRADLGEKLVVEFGSEREYVSVSKDGVSGSAIAQLASEQKVDGSRIKTKLPSLKAELEQVYRVAAAISSQKARFEDSNNADVYRIHIEGISGLTLSSEEKEIALKDINNAVAALTAACKSVYGDQFIVEVLNVSSAIDGKEYDIPSEPHNIRKRDTATEQVPVVKMRNILNVSVFTGTDYPAIFAIFAGLVIALVLAVLYTTVGMMTMDPGKDSIIYRMTTTRMKKD